MSKAKKRPRPGELDGLVLAHKRRHRAAPRQAAPSAAEPREALRIRFAENLVALRGRVGLSGEEAAARAGLHRTAVVLLERRLRLPRLETIVRLGGAVEAEPCALLAGMVWRPGSGVRRPGGRPRPGAFEVEDADRPAAQ